jgi:hypothetical protein
MMLVCKQTTQMSTKLIVNTRITTLSANEKDINLAPLRITFETKDEHPTLFQGSSSSLVTHTAKIEMHQHQGVTV